VRKWKLRLAARREDSARVARARAVIKQYHELTSKQKRAVNVTALVEELENALGDSVTSVPAQIKLDALPERQRAAILEQSRVYGTVDSECVGLDHFTVRPAASWLDDSAPEDAVAVEFAYRYADGPTGLEVTVFAADGDVVTSQDFG
jgi:hypothetical protein